MASSPDQPRSGGEDKSRPIGAEPAASIQRKLGEARSALAGLQEFVEGDRAARRCYAPPGLNRRLAGRKSGRER